MQAALTGLFTQDMPATMLKGCGQGQSLNCPYGQPLGASVLYFHLTKNAPDAFVPEYDFLHGKEPNAFMRETLAIADKELSAKHGPEIAKWLVPTNDKTWTHQSAMQVPWAGVDERIVQHPDQKRGSMAAMYVFKNGKVTMCDAIPPGQSGFIAPDGTKDPHYRDQQLLYTNFGCHPRRITAEEVEKYKTSEKRLTF
jgi:penicillin amidase